MSDQNRRTNKPLKGLLDFCTSVTSGEDGTGPSEALDPQVSCGLDFIKKYLRIKSWVGLYLKNICVESRGLDFI